MLVEFSVQNHRSYREKQSFLMTASNSGTPNAVATGNNGAPHVLLLACLFGANGSGKSGLIRGMNTVRALVPRLVQRRAKTHQRIPSASLSFRVAQHTDGIRSDLPA